MSSKFVIFGESSKRTKIYLIHHQNTNLPTKWTLNRYRRFLPRHRPKCISLPFGRRQSEAVIHRVSECVDPEIPSFPLRDGLHSPASMQISSSIALSISESISISIYNLHSAAWTVPAVAVGAVSVGAVGAEWRAKRNRVRTRFCIDPPLSDSLNPRRPPIPSFGALPHRSRWPAPSQSTGSPLWPRSGSSFSAKTCELRPQCTSMPPRTQRQSTGSCRWTQSVGPRCGRRHAPSLWRHSLWRHSGRGHGGALCVELHFLPNHKVNAVSTRRTVQRERERTCRIMPF